jgi:hypothetical protein
VNKRSTIHTFRFGMILLTNPFVNLYVFGLLSLIRRELHFVQKFDFNFEEEDSIDGMKKLIVAEVNAFRAEVRAQARAAGQIRRQDRSVYYRLIRDRLNHDTLFCSLPIPTRDEILNSPVQEYAPHNGATSGFTTSYANQRLPSPIMDDPSEELERELAATHIGRR